MTQTILDAIDNNDIQYLLSVDIDINARIREYDNDTIFLYAMGVGSFTHIDFLFQKSPMFML